MDNQQVSALHEIPGKSGYFCDEFGNIYSTNRGNSLRKLSSYEHYGKSKKQPYMRVKLKDKLFLVHRLVLAAKLGRELEKEEFVNHINGIAIDNRFENLEAVTHKQNMEHASRNKLLSHGKSWYDARGLVFNG